MNIGCTAPQNAVYNRLLAKALGRGEEQRNPKKQGWRATNHKAFGIPTFRWLDLRLSIPEFALVSKLRDAVANRSQ